jgi:hypothetical protein
MKTRTGVKAGETREFTTKGYFETGDLRKF